MKKFKGHVREVLNDDEIATLGTQEMLWTILYESNM